MKPSAASSNHWLDIDDAALMMLLAEHGQDLNTLKSHQDAASYGPGDEAVLVPLPAGWLRLGMEDDGRLTGQWLSDPVEQRPVAVPLVFVEPEIDELRGWVVHNRGIVPSLAWWYRILRDPRRERYAVTIHDRLDPEPRLVLIGIYPDMVLCEGQSPTVAFVEPHPDDPDRARARLLPVATTSPREVPRVLAEGPAAGVRVAPCSTRRFIKVGTGVRSTRTWQLFDATWPDSKAIATRETVHDPDLVDVALLEGEPVLIQATNANGQWCIGAAELDGNQVQKPWCVAEGEGQVCQILGVNGSALARISRGDSNGRTEDLCLMSLSEAPPAGAEPLLSSPGTFALNWNIATTAVGFVAVELTAGSPAVNWYLDRAGRVLNPSGHRPRADVRFVRERLVSSDGYEYAVDIRWPGCSTTFRGPVILMVYGAYGIDIDLDSARELRRWLDRGYAVATAHVRGGGDAHRHRAGSRGRRDRSVADTVAAVEWLRSGRGAVTADTLCVIGASAGGFLAASLLTEESVTIDAAVIVNGYIDPLEALLRHPSLTVQADRDEWGDPEHDPSDREVLGRLSPLRKLTTPRAPTLVIISAKDARVDPRQGLTWALRSRELGGDVTLWYDPDGSHDQWGARMQPDVLIDWVANALEPHKTG